MRMLSFLIALAAIGVMGFATQRGGTCTVAAIEEIVCERRIGRLLALVEASLWVGGGLILLNAAGVLAVAPAGYAAGLATIAGGAVFGIGAFVNRACAFSTVARLGAGDWSYLATPVGFFLGSLLTLRLPPPMRLNEGSIVLEASTWLAVLSVALVAVRMVTHGRAIRRQGIAPLAHLWSPHVATTVIGLTFLIAFVMVGSWTYTDTLVAFAHGTMVDLAPRLLLCTALVAGAIVGAWTAGRFRPLIPTTTSVARCLAGGMLMGVGTMLIPGSNDGLILVGMPLLRPYAWAAFASMCLAIYAATRVASLASGAKPDAAAPG